MSQLQEYAGKQLHNALHSLEEYTPAADEEVLHQLRVSLKKIKAVVEYIATLHPKKAKQLSRKLKPFFHAAGSIREAQLRFIWLKKKSYNYLLQASLLEKKIGEEEELFFQQKEAYHHLLTSVRHELNKLLKEIKEDALLEYGLTLKEELDQKISTVAKEDWHALRKLIKQLLYAHHWLTEQNKLKVLMVISYHMFDHLQEQIGIWHDLFDLQQWMLDEQFFLSKDASVKQQHNKASEQLQKNLLLQEQAVLRQLLVIKKPVKRK